MKATNILLALSLVLASSLASHAQVGIGTASPAASSVLDLTSTTKGFLPPRMTATERAAIGSPENGLIVYQTDGSVGLWVYNGSTSTWTLSTAANTAATVTNVAAGTIAAVTVQGALNELDSEKAGLASPTFTGTVTAPTFDGDLTGDVTGDLIGNAATATLASTVTTNADLLGEVTSSGNSTTIVSGAVTTDKIASGAVTTAKILDANVTYAKVQNVSGPDKVLGRTTAGAGVIEEIATTGSGDVVRATSPTLVTPVLGAATGTSLSVSDQLTSTVATGTAPLVVTSTTPVANLNIGGNAATATLASTVTTNADLSGAVVSTGNTTSLGTFTSTELSTALFDKTGTGVAVFADSPILLTPDLGTPSFLEGTNITGTAAGLTAGTVTTNADLSGAVVSTGNTTSLGAFSSADLAGALSDETGTGVAVLQTSPTLVTPKIGTNGTAVTEIIMNSQAAVIATVIIRNSTTEVTYPVANVTAGATAFVSFDAALNAGNYVAYTRTTGGNVIVGYGNATTGGNTNQNLSANATNIKITVIQ